jgi:hypothetical protein
MQGNFGPMGRPTAQVTSESPLPKLVRRVVGSQLGSLAPIRHLALEVP